MIGYKIISESTPKICYEFTQKNLTASPSLAEDENIFGRTTYDQT